MVRSGRHRPSAGRKCYPRSRFSVLTAQSIRRYVANQIGNRRDKIADSFRALRSSPGAQYVPPPFGA